jgi:hypothetical protein
MPPISEFGKSCTSDAECYKGLLCRDLLLPATGAKLCTMLCTGFSPRPSARTAGPASGFPGSPGNRSAPR